MSFQDLLVKIRRVNQQYKPFFELEGLLAAAAENEKFLQEVQTQRAEAQRIFEAEKADYNRQIAEVHDSLRAEQKRLTDAQAERQGQIEALDKEIEAKLTEVAGLEATIAQRQGLLEKLKRDLTDLATNF